jgi:aryl-alcohol dehydrogenase-like predicted oxidoreductase
MLHKPGITAPIIGATKLKHVEDALQATHLRLTPEDIEYLEEPYQPKAISGHN